MSDLFPQKLVDDLADIVTDDQADEQVRSIAHDVALFYITLRKAKVPKDDAAGLTSDWMHDSIQGGHCSCE